VLTLLYVDYEALILIIQDKRCSCMITMRRKFNIDILTKKFHVCVTPTDLYSMFPTWTIPFYIHYIGLKGLMKH